MPATTQAVSQTPIAQPLAPAGVPVLDVDPFSIEFLTNPYPGHERIREAGAVVWLPQYAIYVTARHAQVREVLMRHETYISSAGVGLANFNKEPPFRPKSLILEADPPSHTRARNILARILSPRVVVQIREAFTADAHRMVDAMVTRAAQGQVVDAVKELCEPYPLKVFPDAVGLEAVGRENLLLYGDMIFNSFGPGTELFLNAAQRVKPVTAWIMEHCQRGHLRPGGFGDLIYQAADAGEITHDEAPMLVRSFLSAGVDTTVNGLGNALLCLAQNPEQFAKLRANPGLARNAFEESIRVESSVQTFFRTTNADVTLADVRIPEGNKVLALLGAANRDPRQWADTARFDIERKTGGHVGFGVGIHGCVGQVVARLEGEIVLTTLAERVKSIALAGEPVRRLNNTLRALASLPLRLVPA